LDIILNTDVDSVDWGQKCDFYETKQHEKKEKKKKKSKLLEKI